MSGLMGWSPVLMRWRSSLVNSANAWRILKGCWKDCARPSLDGLRPARYGNAICAACAAALIFFLPHSAVTQEWRGLGCRAGRTMRTLRRQRIPLFAVRL